MAWQNLKEDIAEEFAGKSKLDRFDPNVAFSRHMHQSLVFIKPRRRDEVLAAPPPKKREKKKREKRPKPIKLKKPIRTVCVGCKGPMPEGIRSTRQFCNGGCRERYRHAEHVAAADRSPLRSAASIAMSRSRIRLVG